MDILIYLFIAATLAAAVLATLAIKAPRKTWIRFLAVGTAMVFIPIVYLQSVELLGKPKPASFEWWERANDTAVVLDMVLDEGEKIYLWLQIPGDEEPRAYVIPWNLKLAEKLEDAIETHAKKNSTIVLKNPFYRRNLQEWGDLNVEIIPPPLPPGKGAPPEPNPLNPRSQEI